MSDEIKITVCRPFLNVSSMVDAGDEISVSAERARDLERNGLASPNVKAAPKVENKKAPDPENKAAGASIKKVKV